MGNMYKICCEMHILYKTDTVIVMHVIFVFCVWSVLFTVLLGKGVSVREIPRIYWEDVQERTQMGGQLAVTFPVNTCCMFSKYKTTTVTQVL